MIADELRALADEINRTVSRAELSVIEQRLRTLADRLQGKVVIAPHLAQNPTSHTAYVFTDSDITEVAYGATEAEAIANLQAALDAAERGEG